MNDLSLLMPPIAFLVILAAVVVLSAGLSRLGVKKRIGPRGLEPYACGEDAPDQVIQPDYGQFLPFAFFFTLLHVVALMVTTAPREMGGASLVLALVYVIGAVVGLSVLYSR